MQGESQPVIRSTNLVLDLRYRRRIYRSWLFYEIHPRLDYPREEDFNVTPSVQFTLSVVFGAI